MKAAQVEAQKKQEAEIESLRTQLIFKQHEIEASRKAMPRAPVSSPVGSPKTQRSDLPRTPHSHHVAVFQGLSQRPVVPPPRVSKSRPLLPGFVNAFAKSPQKKDKGKGKAHVSVIESQRTHEQDLDPPLPSPFGFPVRALAHSQADEGMYIDGGEVGGQAGGTTYPDADFHMDLADGVKTPQPIAEVLRASKPFDWVNWVCLQQLPYFTRLGLTF